MNKVYWVALAAVLVIAGCNHHDFDDPSTRPFLVEWASCNLGASAPEEVGTYFAWAEVEGKDHYSWDDYRYSTKEPKMTKYNPAAGTPGTTVLESGDDAATVILGNGWRTPTKADWQELVLKGVWRKEVLKGIAGMMIYSRATGERIMFLPVTGMMQGTVCAYSEYSVSTGPDGNPTWTGGQMHYWSSELRNYYCPDAWYFGLDDSGYGNLFTAYRSYGMPIRAVRDKK